ncbi:MAG: hypothetical protein QOI11_541 [Candidatus Eremiobacteraeota bacterium]|jgi:hypothetical protein|nr:hypothetical protein [Candidatus Eremiobacteraeota bacterium]
MLRPRSLLLAAALFTFSSPVLAATPAHAAEAAPATEAAYAGVLRTINPKLPLAKARSYARSVMADAWRTHLDPRFIMSIVTVESHWRVNAVSRVGARGLGQLMPGTAARLGVRNSWNASDNLRGTSRYLQTLMNQFAGKPNAVKLAIAGYNAGPKAVERFHGIPPYAETRNYVVRVLHVWNQLNARVGGTFASAPDAVRVAERTPPTPEERQWLSDANQVLPDAPAVEIPAAAALTGGAPTGSAAAATEPAK